MAVPGRSQILFTQSNYESELATLNGAIAPFSIANVLLTQLEYVLLASQALLLALFIYGVAIRDSNFYKRHC